MERYSPKKRYSPKEKRQRRKALYGVGMAVVSLLLAGGMGWYIFIADGTRLDENMCPVEEGPSSVSVVIVDVTDPYNSIQWQNVKNRLSEIKKGIPKHGLLALFSVTKSVPKTLEPEVELCNPGSGQQSSIWTGNPQLKRRRWQESFIAPIDSILTRINAEGPRRTSPIMETVQAAKAHVGAYDTDARRLVIVSDMMQHTDEYSHYGPRPPEYDPFESTALNEKLSADLSGWQIEILYAWRGGAESQVQGQSHVAFWNQYFQDNGATLQRVVRIDG